MTPSSKLQMADIWSCGIILYAMLFGRYPFNARERDYARKIVSAQYVLPPDVPVSAECADLLTRVLVRPPASPSPHAGPGQYRSSEL